MTYFERIDEMKNNIAMDLENATEAYKVTELDLVNLFSEQINGAEVTCALYGNGKVTAITGDTLDNAILDITFVDITKRFSLMHIMTNKFIKLVNEDVIKEVWDKVLELHTDITTKYKELETTAYQIAVEAEKKAIAEKKAEEKHQKLKEKALQDFDMLIQQANNSLSDIDEFYYALGWLTKHVGSISASLPDYLDSAFTKYFGSNTPHRVVDSKKRTTGGYSMQWTFGFHATLRKPENIPVILTKYLSTTGKAIANTSFIWDLIDNYGFQFGKKQDVEKIKNNVPAKHLASFETGLTA